MRNSKNNFVPNAGLRKFRHGKSISLVVLTKLIDCRACWPHFHQSLRRCWRSMLYPDHAHSFCTRPSTVTLCCYYFDLLWICRTTCSYSCAAAVDKTSIDSASRGPSAVDDRACCCAGDGRLVHANVRLDASHCHQRRRATVVRTGKSVMPWLLSSVYQLSSPSARGDVGVVCPKSKHIARKPVFREIRVF